MPKIISDENIFQAAIGVIVEKGYSGATTKEIAKAADISEMTLFRKFENKAQLVIRAFDSLLTQMDIDAATRYTGDVAVDLGRVVRQYLRLADLYGPLLVVLLAEVPRHTELRALIEHPRAMVEAVAALISRYQEQGILLKQDPLQAVVDLIGPLIYSAMVREAMSPDLLGPIDALAHVGRFLQGHRA